MHGIQIIVLTAMSVHACTVLLLVTVALRAILVVHLSYLIVQLP